MDTGSQPEGRRPRTSEEVHLLVPWRRSSPEPAAAASAPLVDCPWTSSALPGSIHTGEGQLLITILYYDPFISFIHLHLKNYEPFQRHEWVVLPLTRIKAGNFHGNESMKRVQTKLVTKVYHTAYLCRIKRDFLQMYCNSTISIQHAYYLVSHVLSCA